MNEGQEPVARGNRTKGSSQLPGAADRGAIPLTVVTQIFLAVSLASERAFHLHDSDISHKQQSTPLNTCNL